MIGESCVQGLRGHLFKTRGVHLDWNSKRQQKSSVSGKVPYFHTLYLLRAQYSLY